MALSDEDLRVMIDEKMGRDVMDYDQASFSLRELADAIYNRACEDCAKRIEDGHPQGYVEQEMDDESDEQQNRLREMFAAVGSAYDAEVRRTGKHPDITLIHPDLYDWLLTKLIEKGLLKYVVDRPMKYRRSIARRLPRQNIDTDYSVEFRKDTTDR